MYYEDREKGEKRQNINHNNFHRQADYDNERYDNEWKNRDDNRRYSKVEDARKATRRKVNEELIPKGLSREDETKNDHFLVQMVAQATAMTVMNLMPLRR